MRFGEYLKETLRIYERIRFLEEIVFETVTQRCPILFWGHLILLDLQLEGIHLLVSWAACQLAVEHTCVMHVLVCTCRLAILTKRDCATRKMALFVMCAKPAPSVHSVKWGVLPALPTEPPSKVTN